MHATLPNIVTNPHYQKLGGEAAIRALVARFYQLMAELPEAAAIRAMHPADLGPSAERLFMFLSGWLGGPPLYAERHGPPRLGRVHAGFAIDAPARDAWMLCMGRALDEQVADPAFRAQLMAAFAKVAQSILNH